MSSIENHNDFFLIEPFRFHFEIQFYFFPVLCVLMYMMNAKMYNWNFKFNYNDDIYLFIYSKLEMKGTELIKKMFVNWFRFLLESFDTIVEWESHVLVMPCHQLKSISATGEICQTIVSNIIVDHIVTWLIDGTTVIFWALGYATWGDRDPRA